MMRRYRTEFLLCLALLAITAAPFARAVENGLINYDDNDYVSNNQRVLTGLSWANVRWAMTATRAANWHPLTWVSLQLDATLFGPEPWGFHLTNVVLHALNTVLLFLALRRLTGDVWPSATVAAFFAVHPLHVESVAWVAERKDVLSGLFWMLTLLAYGWYAERPGAGRYALVALGFVLGLMAKPMLVTLPCVLLLLDYWPLKRITFSAKGGVTGLGRALAEKIPLFALTAAACVVTVYAQRKGGAVTPLENVPPGARVLNSLTAYAGYLGQMVWPAGLAPFYPHPRGGIDTTRAFQAVLILLALTGLVVWACRRRYLTVGWLWFLGTLVPVIGLVQVGSQAMADRYTYLPYIGLFVAVAWTVNDFFIRRPIRSGLPGWATALLLPLGVAGGLTCWRLVMGPVALPERFSRLSFALLAVGTLFAGGLFVASLPRRRLVPWPGVAGMLALGVCAGLTTVQVSHWQNSVWLWEWASQVTRDSDITSNNLGNAYFNSVHPDRLKLAAEQFRKALKLSARNAKAMNNLGLIALEEGRPADALDLFVKAGEIDPTLAVVHDNVGLALQRLGRFSEAIPHHRRGLDADPDWARARSHLGYALAWTGDNPGAVKELREAARLAPRYRGDLAWALARAGEKDEAAALYAQLLQEDEAWADNTREIAWKQATAAESRRRLGHEALRRAEQACQATGDADVRALDTLAAAQAELGDYAKAVASARRARALAKDDPELVKDVEARLRLYESGRPYRQE